MSDRLGSLDALRGFVIASMLVVNMTWDRNALPAWLFHVPWNDPAQGASFTDLVFPWFVFMAGCAAPLSMRSGRGRGKAAGAMVRAAFIRAAKLYLLGVLLTVASFAHETPITWDCLLRWNILQLLGAAYFFVVVAQLAGPRLRVGLVIGVLLLKGATYLLPYATVTELVTPRPTDDGLFGPGTWAHFDAVKQLLNLEFVADPTWWTRLVGWCGMAQQYLPLAAIGVVGALATETLIDERSRRAAVRIAAAGAALVVGGFVLQAGYDPAGGGLWGTATVPFSKWLFSPAYCLLAAGTGCLLLAAFFAAIDLGRCRPLATFQPLGRNALAIYVAAELSFKLVFARWRIPLPAENGADPPTSDSVAAATQAWIEFATGSPAAASLGWAALWLAGWWWVAARLDAKAIYLRV